MFSDVVLRALGLMVCLYAIAYFVTSISVAALTAVRYNTGPACGQTGCVTRASDALSASEPTYEPAWMVVAYLPFN